MKVIIILSVFCFVVSGTLFGQYQSKYPEIPIVDVHAHGTGVNDISNYLKVKEIVKQQFGSNIAFFICLSPLNEPVAEVKAAGKNQFFFAVSEMTPHKGLNHTPEEIVAMVKDEFVGLKFWFGDPRGVLKEGEAGITKIDDPGYEKLFSTLERNHILMTSLHVSSPNGPFDNRQVWMKDPVYFWGQIRAFENVLAKYPKLTIIAAHSVWLTSQDAQIDFLRYMLATYPNLYMDISATFEYFHLVNRENLRDLFIEYQDRILFGADFLSMPDHFIENAVNGYANRFCILETDQVVMWGNTKPIQGLNLPREVLEKLYYKNALKLYPGLKEAMDL
jgi:predicted TIM-barrel fold metal-dependent hydrolase